MRERIILAPGIGATELLGTLARLGVNTIGTHVVSGGQLADLALMKSGIAVTEPHLTASEDVAVIYSILEDCSSDDYFGQSGTIEDAIALSREITILRGLCVDDEAAEIAAALADGEFPDKNDALVSVYQERADRVKAKGKVDTIDRIRKALAEAEPFNAKFLTLKECHVTPLEQALIQKLSANEVSEVSIGELAGGKKFPARNEKADNAPVSLTEAYGAINEAENIIDTIYKTKSIEPDTCIIACAAPSEYAQLIYDIARQHDVPVTFGTGVPITNARPAELLRLVMAWDGPGLHGVDALRAILKSVSFDRKALDETLGVQTYMSGGEEKEAHCYHYLDDLANMAGRLQLSFDPTTNKEKVEAYSKVERAGIAEQKKKGGSAERRALRKERILNWLPAFSDALSSGMAEFFEKYAFVRPAPDYERGLDFAAKAAITENLRAYSDHLDAGSTEGICKSILKRMVCPRGSDGGSVHVTDIKGAMMALRENLFVCGLSASNYPGRPVENHLVLDSDFAQFGEEGKKYQSAKIVRQRIEDFNALMKLAESCGSNIRLSYSGFNIAELKKANPSSVIFDQAEKADGTAGYFDSSIQKFRYAGRAYKDQKVIDFKEAAVKDFFEDVDEKELLERYWAATDIEEYLNCPRQFCFDKVFGISVEEEDNPLKLMENYATGNLAHDLMERLADAGTVSVTKEQFLSWSEAAFDDFFLGRIPVSKEAMADEKERFMEMMENTYEWEQTLAADRDVLSAEDEFKFEHPSGMRVKGYPDRVEKMRADGKYVIKDFKTKSSFGHKADDFKTCIQVIVYAWIYKQHLIEQGISNPDLAAEYMYLRQEERIPCRYDERMEEKLAELLAKMKDSILNHKFERGTKKKIPDKEVCAFCNYQELCVQWPTEEDSAEGKNNE